MTPPRPRPHERPRHRTSHPARDGVRTRRRPRKRFPLLPVALLVLLIVGAAGTALLSAGLKSEPERAGAQSMPMGESSDEGSASAKAAAPAEKAVPTPKPAASAPQTPAAEPTKPASHPTFGAHTSADQPCVSCHPKKPGKELACRSCHGMKCGKNSKTVADCLECHKTGTTTKWVAED